MELLSEILGGIDDEINKANDYIDIFKLPIEYIEDKIPIKENIINDIELMRYNNSIDDISNNDISSNEIINNYMIEPEKLNKNLYYTLLNPETNYDKIYANRWCKYYTNNKEYLHDTQYLIENFKTIENKEDENKLDISYNNELYSNCSNIIYDNGFTNRYEYISLPFMKQYNGDKIIMQFWALNNLLTPIFNLILPILMILVPFFLIKLQGHDLTINMYLKYLRSVMSSNPFCNILFNFRQADNSTRLFMIFSMLFYIFQLYNNTIDTIKYYRNIKYINKTLIELRHYIKYSINNINNLVIYTGKLETYKLFTNSLNSRLNVLTEYYNEIKGLTEYKLTFSKIYELGQIMKSFYRLNRDKILISSIYYAFGCNSYINSITYIQKLVNSNKINKCIFSNKTEFKNSYFGDLLKYDSPIIKNTYKLDNNLLLTGPNAGGKTTILKSTLFNIILSQQIGYGFYESAKIKLYDHIHCYINIPETSSRDSLFQAEAKLCKNILDIIEEYPDANHLCLFDEIYSGTNPEDAIDAGYKYITYLNKFKNVNIILTTHYFKLCKKLSSNINKNYHMDIKEDNNNIIFKYKLKKGISKIRGGSKILKDLDYPDIFNKS